MAAFTDLQTSLKQSENSDLPAWLSTTVPLSLQAPASWDLPKDRFFTMVQKWRGLQVPGGFPANDGYQLGSAIGTAMQVDKPICTIELVLHGQ